MLKRHRIHSMLFKCQPTILSYVCLSPGRRFVPPSEVFELHATTLILELDHEQLDRKHYCLTAYTSNPCTKPKHLSPLLSSQVFLQKSAVNLLSSVLDTPEFFWHAPDSFQVGHG